MKKIVAFGASSSKNSINKKLASYVAQQIKDAEVKILDLNDYEMPIYSVDREGDSGIPDLANQFKNEIRDADGIVISFAEHNGTYTAAFKNIFDWVSRIEKSLWLGKPMLLLATSPGGRGGATLLASAVTVFGYMDGNVIGHLAVPKFGENFSDDEGILDEKLKTELVKLLTVFQSAI